MTSLLSVVCAKWGKLYGADYVNRLYRGVLRNTQRDVNFVCVTDDSTGIDSAITCLDLKAFSFSDTLEKAQSVAPKRNGAYTKLAVFKDGFLPFSGPALALDLDVIITGSLDHLADFAPGHIAMAPPFARSSKRPTFGEGSVIKFEPEHHGFLFSDMANATEEMVRTSHGSEQSYTSGRAIARGMFTPFPNDWVVSFKRHCRPKRPLNFFMAPTQPKSASVVCFHGSPNVEQAIEGVTAGLFKRTRPAPWVADHWA